MSASTFSYAQAAKGMSTPITASKPTSGSATPAKDGAPATMNGSVGHVPSWADEAEDETLNKQSQPTRDAQPQEASSKPVQQTQSADASGVSSPEIGASSTSTAIKDDDVASLPNEASDSTWDNKSQASTSVDKSVDGAEKSPEKGKKSKSAPAKPFQEAPLPAVNFWQKRAEEQKAKAPKSNPSLTNGASHVNSGAQAKKSGLDAKARPADSDNKAKGHDEDRPAHGRKDTRVDAESKKEAKSRSYDKDAKSTPSTLPPPPNRDQAAWPTPETVIDEDRKKAQEKGDKERKDERKENTVAGSNGKHEWVKVPYIPSVVFSTPLPNTANTRRGGKAGGRGGAHGGGRSTAAGAHAAGQSERDASAPATNGDGDQSKRERADGTAADASPKSKRNGSATSPTLRSQVPASNGEKPFRASGPPASDFEARPRGASLPTDGPHASNHNSAYPRQYPRQNKPRRGEFSGAGERRRDGEGSPTKDNTFDDRRPHTATADGDGERRASAYNDGTSGHQHKQGRFGSYGGGRERGGRGGRGGRGYANGYQHTNGHVAPLQTSNPFTMGPRSPTVFNPEHGAYFAAPQGKYGRSSHRSQSVTTDQYRFPTYQAGQAPAPLQTYGMHDYSQAPMSAQPYAPYVDQFHLFAMITTQLEYYFSVENLIKDMYLRQHMDSQGLVALEFIAGFNRIKILSTDLELIKLVCQQSRVVEYRIGEDGRDRLRRKDGWEKWVLAMGDRHESAQNEGPKELNHPSTPHPIGFDQANPSPWPMSAGAPTAPYGIDTSFPQTNGLGNGVAAAAAAHDNTFVPENLPNGTASDSSNIGTVPNGHPIEST